MKLDMIPILSGAVDELPFSFTFSPAENTRQKVSVEAEEHEDLMAFYIDGVTFPKEAEVNGKVVNRGGYMELFSDAVITYETQCARCLTPLSGSVTLHIEKAVAEEKGAMSLEDKENDDYLQIKGGKLDLVLPIRDEFLLSFPMRFLCKEDCKGLCTRCGADLNLGECACEKKVIDPRFAKLAALLDDMSDDE